MEFLSLGKLLQDQTDSNIGEVNHILFIQQQHLQREGEREKVQNLSKLFSKQGS